jgi:hypothetical protein
MKSNFPLYTAHHENNIFVKHLAENKCITVATWLHAPSITINDHIIEVNTCYFDEVTSGKAQPITKARFDIERQQVINQLIHG